jgi:aryl carrier-like protein
MWIAGAPIEYIPPIKVAGPHSRIELVKTDIADPLALIEVMAICSAVLNQPTISPGANLLDVGCDSLKTARIAMHIKRQLHCDLSLRDIYSNPTPFHLARLVDDTHKLRSAIPDLIVLPNGHAIRGPSSNTVLQEYKESFVDRIFLQHGLFIADGATVVDMGAGVGLFSMFCLQEASDVRLYSFEHDSRLFELLRFNLIDVGPTATVSSTVIGYRSDPSTRGGETIGQLLQIPIVGEIHLLKVDERSYSLNILNNHLIDSEWCRIKQVVAQVREPVDGGPSSATILQSHGFNTISVTHSRQRTFVYATRRLHQ